MFTILAAMLAPFVGFGTATFIFATLLAKSNNIGGEKSEPDYYAALYRFDTRIDHINRQDSLSCAMTYRKDLRRYAEPDPEEEVHAITRKEAANMVYKKKPKTSAGPKILQDQYDFDGDLPSVDKPLFKPKD